MDVSHLDPVCEQVTKPALIQPAEDFQAQMMVSPSTSNLKFVVL